MEERIRRKELSADLGKKFVRRTPTISKWFSTQSPKDHFSREGENLPPKCLDWPGDVWGKQEIRKTGEMKVTSKLIKYIIGGMVFLILEKEVVTISSQAVWKQAMTVMCHSVTETHSEKCMIRWFHPCVSISVYLPKLDKQNLQKCVLLPIIIPLVTDRATPEDIIEEDLVFHDFFLALIIH
jgi:hypothetical protein